ncbi:hypothetical protein [Terrabacter sp. NPDC000476]|uniref:hypothetical protein n=1 Tax=Terrabacter sp. NPDC000476 TaxID=3154258 RepID=UPI003322176B
MSDRDNRYRHQRDRYRAVLVEVVAVAVVGGTTVALDFVPREPRLHDDIHHRARQLRA